MKDMVYLNISRALLSAEILETVTFVALIFNFALQKEDIDDGKNHRVK